MNKELVKKLYWDAVNKCEEGNAWEFEEYFVKAVLKEVETILDYSPRDTKNQIEIHFGVKL